MKPSTQPRYLVALSPAPGIGGFTYDSLPRAIASLRDTRQRWPNAQLVVIPPRPKSPQGNPCSNPRRSLCRP